MQHHSTSFSGTHIVNSTKIPLNFCQIGPRNLGESLYEEDEVASCSGMYTSKECQYLKTKPFETSMLNPDEDPRSAVNLVNRSLHKRCQILSNGRRRELHPQVVFFAPADHRDQFERIAELACNVNRSMNFIALDSILYHVFAERLGLDLLARRDQTAAVIIDHEVEFNWFQFVFVFNMYLTFRMNQPS